MLPTYSRSFSNLLCFFKNSVCMQIERSGETLFLHSLDVPIKKTSAYKKKDGVSIFSITHKKITN